MNVKKITPTVGRGEVGEMSKFLIKSGNTSIFYYPHWYAFNWMAMRSVVFIQILIYNKCLTLISQHFKKYIYK